jgi:phosphoenolpyruvate---glycerone phosphotransferase subunit DhaL
VIAGAAVRTTTIHAWMTAVEESVKDQRDYLTQLDAAIGDGDHGVNMNRGFEAVGKALAAQDGSLAPGKLLTVAGKTLVSTVGGASGPLYGLFFLQLGLATAGKPEIDVAEFAAAMDNAITRVQGLGKAEPGDKTMLEALLPAQAALHRAVDEGASPADALRAATAAAEEGMLGTIPLVARKGRASYLGERSAGHQDPGATSTHLLLKAAADAWSPA